MYFCVGKAIQTKNKNTCYSIQGYTFLQEFRGDEDEMKRSIKTSCMMSYQCMQL